MIKKDYFQAASSFEPDLKRCQLLQNGVSFGAKDKSARHDNYEATLIEYYHVLSDIIKKFPDNCIEFEWYGTLGYKPQHCTFTLWRMEQLQAVYQMAALHSQKAADQNTYTEAGSKAAYKFLKVAAGIFDYLVKTQFPHQLPDFDTSTLSFLRDLMLAQAQEVIWQKATLSDSMKDSAIAKVAIKAAELYSVAADYGNRSDSVVLDWTNHCKVKSSHFAAAAHHRMSISALDAFKYGEQVGHLKAALRLCDEGLKSKRYVGAKVLEELEALKGVVAATLASAEKDNDLVYLKPVPDEAHLPPITGVSMVALELPANFLERPENTPAKFASLVPFTIVQVAQAFRERQEQFLKEHVDEPLDALSRMFARFCAERDLPASIDSIQRPEDVPDSLLLHSREIINIGGVNLIESSMIEIGRLASQCNDLVRCCEEKIRIETREDQILRDRAGPGRWNREPSSSAASALNTRICRMKDFLEQGRQSDTVLVLQYRDIKDYLVVYGGGKEALKANIPRSTYVKVDSATGRLIGELRELLAEADRVEQNRQRLKLSVAVKNREHNILPTVMSEYKKNPSKFSTPEGALDETRFEPVYEKFIRLFDTDLQYVELLKKRQMDLESRIQGATEQLRAGLAARDQSQEKRHEALQLFENAYASYLELVSNLNQASKFYTDFLEKGSVVMDDVDQYLYARREEARELEILVSQMGQLQEIEHNMSSELLHAPKGQRTWDPSRGIRFL